MSVGRLIKKSWFGAVALALGLGGAVLAGDATTKPKDKPYPLTVCVVSGEKLGEMGEPHVIHFKGREIKFCCDHCEKDFRTEPQKYLAKLDKASATQPATQKTEGRQHDHKH